MVLIWVEIFIHIDIPLGTSVTVVKSLRVIIVII